MDKERKSQYDQQYRRDHIVRKLLSFNRENSDDMMIWEYLKTVDNVNAYIKDLIRADMK